MTVIKQEPNNRESDFLTELGKHVNRWVAITGYGSDMETIVATADSISEARKVAETKGFKNVTFLKVPPTDRFFVPSIPAKK